MLIFWSLVRNSVVLAVYLLFSVACFLTVHEHLSDDYIFLRILDLTLRTAGEGDGERHDADTPDEHSDHDDDFTGDIPLRRESHREADGAEGGDSFEEGILKIEVRRRL